MPNSTPNTSFNDRLLQLIKHWQDEFISLDRRNRLIHCNPESKSVVDLISPDLAGVISHLATHSAMPFAWKDALLESIEYQDDDEPPELETIEDVLVELDKVEGFDPAENLLSDLSDSQLAARLRTLRDNSRTAETEQGITILYLAIGLLRWYESPTSDTEFLSPLLLLPVSLNRKGLGQSWSLSLADGSNTAPSDNRALALRLKELAIELPDAPEALDGVAEYFAAIQELIDSQPSSRAELVHKVVLGVFPFQKLAMFEDLAANSDYIADQRLVRLLAGDAESQGGASLFAPSDSVNDFTLRPHDLFTVKDCDHSQLKAVVYARDKMDLVIDGPPGTGKSQTITNIIADALARGKTVLFVSEKVAALEVVKSRLSDVGLGDYCLELHSHKQKRKDVLAELVRCLDMPRSRLAVDEAALDRLASHRKELNGYVAAIHSRKEQEPWTLFEIAGQLASLHDAPDVHCSLSHCMGFGRAEIEDVRSRLASFAFHTAFITSGGHHPWERLRGGTLSLGQKASLNTFFQKALPVLSETAAAVATVEKVSRLAAPLTLTQVAGFAEFMQRTPTELFSLPPHWWDMERSVIRGALEEFRTAAEILRSRFRTLSGRLITAPVFDPTHFELIARADTVRQCLPSAGRCSAADAQDASDELLPTLCSFREVAAAFEAQIAEVAPLSGFSIQRVNGMTLQSLLQAVSGIERIVDAGGIDPRLMEPLIRDNVLQCKTAYEAQAKRAAELRAELVDVFLPTAFSNSGESAAEGVAHFRWWWRRFGKRWRESKATAMRFLCQSKPNVKTLFGHVDALLEWHACTKRASDCISSCPLPVPRVAGDIPNFSLLARDADVAAFLCKSGFTAEEVVAACRGIVRNKARIRELLPTCRSSYKALHGLWNRLPKNVQAAIVARENATQMPFAKLQKNVASLCDALGAFRRVISSLLQGCPELLHATIDDLPAIATAVSGLRSACTKAGIECITESDDLLAHLPPALSMLAVLQAFPAVPPPLVRAALESRDRKPSKEVINALTCLASGNALRASRAASELVAVIAPPDELGHPETWRPGEVATWAGSLSESLATIDDFLSFRALMSRLYEDGVGPFVDEVLRGAVAADAAVPAFDKAFAIKKADALIDMQQLRAFSGSHHEQLINRFREIDHASLSLHQARVQAALNRALEWVGSLTHGPEAGSLRAEAAKQRSKKKLRQVFAEIPGLVLKLKPCVMMSPLSVSTFFPGDVQQLRFDLVVIDEASQVRPADAIPAIYRGGQLVVAGDDKQLPPSNFFARTSREDEDDDSDEEAVASGVESILDMCVSANVRRTRLLWHYRSRHESLIAFSNQQFYDGELVTFPSANCAGGITYHRVESGRWIDNTNPAEARAVADLVEAQLREFPEESIGIVTFNKDQQLLVEDELERLRQRLQRAGRNQELLERLGDECAEPVFIKNLENVQGDERDCVILSVAYAKDSDGMFAMRFGPLSQAGGERRLNVAITRARQRMKVVASVSASDFRISAGSPRGTQLLHSFIRFAEEGTQALEHPVGVGNGRHESPFEAAVADALEKRGLVLVPQVGCSRFRIDLAAQHPNDPTRYVLGIECDGATYHRSAVARDRDRLRQEVLEGLGWRMVRIWSLDWIQNRERQIAKVMKAYEASLAATP